jgi:rhodanese-related sulfurtransferase
MEMSSSLVPLSLPLGTRPATRRSTWRIFSQKRIIRTPLGEYSPGTRCLSIPPGAPTSSAEPGKRAGRTTVPYAARFLPEADDGVIIYPTHAQGSPCGEDIGDRLSSTIGYERRFNAFLQFNNAKSFTKYALTAAAPIPTYYPLMKTLNTKGPVVLGNLPPVRGLPPEFFQEAIEDNDNVLIDTRMMLAFGGGHIKGALSIGGLPMLSIWAGWLLDPNQPILLVLESDDTLEAIVRYFVRTGYTKFAGYLVGGMQAWNNAGLPLESVGQMTVHEVKAAGGKLQILDVRAPAEWKDGHIPMPAMFFWVNCANTSTRWTRASRRPSIATAAIVRASRRAFCSSKGSAASATFPEAGKHGRMRDTRSKKRSRRGEEMNVHEHAFSRSIDFEACCLSHRQSCSPVHMRRSRCGGKRGCA